MYKTSIPGCNFPQHHHTLCRWRRSQSPSSFQSQFFLTVATWREYNLVYKESFPAKYFFVQQYIHPPLAALNPPFFVCGVLFVKTSLSTDPRSLLYNRLVSGFLSSANCQFRQLYWCLHQKYVVKYAKETCETAHSTPKETYRNATRFKQQKPTEGLLWEKETITRCA